MNPTKEDFNRELKTLDFSIVSTDGSELEGYKCENILTPDASVYCTIKNENINILLKSNEGPVIITHIIIQSPEIGFTCPLESGILFVSNDKLDIDKTVTFDNFTKDKYSRYRRALDLIGETEHENDPAIFFELKKNNVGVFKLPIPRYGDYVLLKLISSKNPISKSNIDVQYVGFKGFKGKKTFEFGQLI
eukprot:gene3192-5508_t